MFPELGEDENFVLGRPVLRNLVETQSNLPPPLDVGGYDGREGGNFEGICIEASEAK